MAAQPLPSLSVEEYLALERDSDTKHEYYCGHMYDRAGGREPHNRISGNIIIQVGSRVGERCAVYPSDMLMRTAPQGLYTYPDVTIVCDDPKLADGHHDVLLNPTVVIEVLSKSTEGHDRGLKFTEYRRIESLRDYVLVSQGEPRVEVFSRAPEGKWILSEYVGLDAACELPGVGCSVPLSGIYRGVKFEAE